MSDPGVSRKLAAVFYADVAGYSRLTGADEEGTHRLVMDSLDFTAETIKAQGGNVLRYAGDAILAEFSSIVAAVKASYVVQMELHARNLGIPDDRKVLIRIGVNLGDVMEDRGEIFGDGVNLAARLESTAVPGGVCISSAVHEQIDGKTNMVFEDGGYLQFKNIAKPIRIYFWHPMPMEQSAIASTVPPRDTFPVPGKNHPLPPREKPSVAVLPFANMSGDPEQEYFADGMVEEIITGLARLRWLTVIARNSTFAYKGTSPDIRKVGRDLVVRYVLEGSVRKAGDRVRITAQLVEAENGGHLWAERFDGTLADVFDLQDQITAGVVAAIEPSVRRAEIERAKRKRPDNLDAYNLYLHALEQSDTFTSAGWAAALNLLDDAIALDPDYAEAHGVAAFCLQQRFLWGGRAPADREAALRHADAVAAARTDDATALAFAAFAMSSLSGNHDVALAMVERALAQNPSSATAHIVSAVLNLILGHPDKGLWHAKRSLRLSPFDPLRHISETTSAAAMLAVGQREEALVCARRGLEANPVFGPGLTVVALCLVGLGRNDEARAHICRLLEIAPDTRIATLKERFLYANSFDFDRVVADLRAAGLPE